ncbi:MAG: hypothetical protein MUO82_11090 [Candidatus Thermoplasmatota archaeon]|nr:hypothetical protein [Candidatus Thermoplasmatota archaeon]
MTKISSYNKFVELLAKDVLSKLDGTHNDFTRFELPDKPSKIIVLGTLADKSKDRSIVGDTNRTLTSVKNNSLSVKFLIRDSSGSIKVKPSLSLFYRVYPTFDEQIKFISDNYEEYQDNENVDLARVWKRYNFIHPVIELTLSEENIDNTLDLKYAINDIRKDKNIYSEGKNIPFSSLDKESLYAEAINRIKGETSHSFGWNCRIHLQIEEFVQNEEKLNLITVSMINDTEENKGYETFLFDCNLEIDLMGKEPIPFKYEYEYEGFNFEYSNPLRCLNCHADFNGKKINTLHFASFSQEKIIPKLSSDTLIISFEELVNSSKNIALLEKLNKEMQTYLNDYKKISKIKNKEKHERDLNHFEKIATRFTEGINVLKNNTNAKKSFELLNKSFIKSSRYDRWRLFQIIFIVSLIPEIIDKTKNRDICEVLHVATGGGKSEAYFGCVLFSAFFDRLSGKKFGITAITKFPLRMLSVQQLRRISNLFIWAEEIRKEEKIDGDPFTVAYYVGSSDEFPRYTKTIIDEIQRERKNKKEVPGRIIKKCPICNGNVILDFKVNERYIIHKCIECKKEFSLFFTDEEIYRFLPTFIVSTVDKLAGISSNRRYKNILGGKLDTCPSGHGYIPHGDSCEVETDQGRCKQKGHSVNIDFKTGPTLIIQDEMHLVREGFGTINAHFETLMEALQIELCGYGFKNIAMTATITGAKEQIENLYHKDINIFPGASPDETKEHDFFFQYEKDENKNIVVQRKIIGLKPNLRDNQFASLLTLRYLSEFINRVESNLDTFSKNAGFEPGEVNSILLSYKSILTYHNKKSDVHSMNYYLEAVTNSKLEEYKIIPKILTGDSTLEDINILIDLIEKYFDKEENKKSLLSVFATSIVSHGIDIDKWNIMEFQGIPRNTAEYIQALSRSGRKFPGVVFVWFYPNRARDLSFYQNFIDYHNILQQKVEDVPLTRWSRLGLKQTFTSIFNASILNYFSDIVGEPIYTVDKVNEIFTNLENRKKLIDFIQKAYVSNSPMIGAQYFKLEIPNEAEERLNELKRDSGGEKNFFPNALKDNANKYYRTQYGMRGIQDEILLKPNDWDLNFLRNARKGRD